MLLEGGAVDHEGEVLEAFVTKKRDRKAALRFLKKAMKRYGRPEAIVTDRLRSYRAAMRQIGNEARQETGRWLNNVVSEMPLGVRYSLVTYKALRISLTRLRIKFLDRESNSRK